MLRRARWDFESGIQMTIDQLHELQSLAQKARQDFLNEITKPDYTYTELSNMTGLSTQQLFRIVNNESGQPKLETIISSYIQLLSYVGSTPKK